MAERGRPPAFSGAARVFLQATGKTKLQQNSVRRAIINVLVDNQGVMTLDQIDAHFGYDIRESVYGLMKAGWVRLEEAQDIPA